MAGLDMMREPLQTEHDLYGLSGPVQAGPVQAGPVLAGAVHVGRAQIVSLLKQSMHSLKPRRKAAFAVVLLFAIGCRELTQRIDEPKLESAQSSFFVGQGRVPDGKEVEFSSYEALPQTYRKILEKSQFEGQVGPKGEALYGKALYESLDSNLRAALLNLMAKAEATKLHNNSTVLDHIDTISCLHQDRFFGMADEKLRPLVASTETVFHPEIKIDDAMHPAKDAFRVVGNFKTRDERGNLQIVFSTDGQKQKIEIDIDKWQDGPEHFFREVAYNHVFNQLTNPYEVWSILVSKQKIMPPYRIVDKNRTPWPQLAAHL